MPLLITRRTFAPAGRFVPGFGRCETTRPLLTFENFFVTLPALQWARVSTRFAAFSFLPVTLGTTQASFRAKIAWTVCAPVIATTQVPVPEQAPDQPENTEPVAGVAVSVTFVPKS